MKKSIAALALALTLVGTLAACASRDPNANNTTGDQNGVTSGSTGGASGTAGTVRRRYGAESTYNTYNTYNSNDYFEDGRYAAGPDGRVYDSTAARDLTQDARDMIRDAGDVIGDVGRDIGSAARSITGTNSADSITAQ